MFEKIKNYFKDRYILKTFQNASYDINFTDLDFASIINKYDVKPKFEDFVRLIRNVFGFLEILHSITLYMFSNFSILYFARLKNFAVKIYEEGFYLEKFLENFSDV